MSETEDQKIEILQEILSWIRFLGLKEVKEILTNELDDNKKKLIYHLSDGNKGSTEIGKIAKVSHRTVSDHWTSWAPLRIVEPIRVQGGGRYKKVFELEDFGIPIPESNGNATKTQSDE